MNNAQDILMAFVAAFDRHDPDGIVELYAPGAASYWPDTAEGIDVAAVRVTYACWFSAMPDARMQVRSGVADGQKAVAEVVITGTNTGPLALTDVDRAVLATPAEALPPTGRTLTRPIAFAINIADGLVAAERVYFSPLALPLQLGLLTPAPADNGLGVSGSTG
jgi:hypothetical protein